MKHTKEPWRIGLCGSEVLSVPIESNDGFVHITEAHPDDARRIVTCVNACAGIPTHELEQANYVHAYRKVLKDTMQQLANMTKVKT